MCYNAPIDDFVSDKVVIMPALEFSQTNKPSLETLRKWLQQQSEQYDPLEELLRLQQELNQFEQQYNLASDEFIQRYEAGEMGDEIAFVRWAGRYRLYTNLKQAISTSLKLIVPYQPVVVAP
jgi:hypothetical protein